MKLRAQGKTGVTPLGIITLGLFKMNEQELIEMIRFAGRYEVSSDGSGNYTSLPIAPEAILITPESHIECVEFFRCNED